MNHANDIEGLKEAENEIGVFVENSMKGIGDLLLRTKFLLPSPLVITAAGDKLIGYLKTRDGDDGAIIIREAPPGERPPVGTYTDLNQPFRPKLGDVFINCTTAASARVLREAVDKMLEHLESKENEERSAVDAGCGECKSDSSPQEQVGVGTIPEGGGE